MDGFEIFPFNYELIDGDCFAAYPAARHGLDDLMVRQDTGGCGCAVDRDISDHSDLLMDERRRR